MRLPLLFVLVGLLVSGCGIFEKEEEEEVVLACPKVLILGDASQLVRFKPGPGRDITDILYEARLVNFVGKCDYEKTGVDIDLTVMISVERGPASTGREIAFEYFVALPDFRGQPEGKRVLPVAGSFDEGQARLIYQDEVKLFIPLAKRSEGASKEVVLGFQLTPDEVAYNRAQRN